MNNSGLDNAPSSPRHRSTGFYVLTVLIIVTALVLYFYPMRPCPECKGAGWFPAAGPGPTDSPSYERRPWPCGYCKGKAHFTLWDYYLAAKR
jgi:hypothetical protein